MRLEPGALGAGLQTEASGTGLQRGSMGTILTVGWASCLDLWQLLLSLGLQDWHGAEVGWGSGATGASLVQEWIKSLGLQESA